MNVKEIIKEYLEKNGFDGLVEKDCGGCPVGALFFFCNAPSLKCKAAYKVLCNKDNCKTCRNKHERCEFPPSAGSYYMTAKRQELPEEGK